jgi:hypothetical protein
MPHPRGDGMQEQWPAGDGLRMPVRLDQTNEGCSKQRAQEGGQPATSKVRRDQAAPARLALQRVENILGARRDRDPAGQTSRDFLAGLRGKAASKPEPSGTGADLASPC